MKKLACAIIAVLLSFSAIPALCDAPLMSLNDFSNQFALATVLYKTDHANYFLGDYMRSYIDEAGSSIEIDVPTANSVVCLYFPYNSDQINEIILFCKGGGDGTVSKNGLFLLYELCYATGAFDKTLEADDFLLEMGLDFSRWGAGSLDRNGKRYSWVLNNDAGLVFSIQPLPQVPVTISKDDDLSSFTFDELILLRQQIAQELTARPEWKEVTVPQGVWKVGEDIPAGHWTISASDGNGPWIKIGTALESNGLDVDEWKSTMQGFYYDAQLESPSYIFYKENKSLSSFDIELTDGLYVQVKYASVVFSPYVGKPFLGF